VFDSLHDRLTGAFKAIRGRGKVTEADITLAMKEVRMALLEADVNFKVAKSFCDRVAAKAVGESVLKSLSADQQVIKIVHEELTATMGGEAAELTLNVAPPAIIMLVGLQGAGKTTAAGKLALYLRKEKKRSPLLVPADVYRPAAIEQLKTLGKQLNVPVFSSTTEMDPVEIAKLAVTEASAKGYDTVILDTAGRLQVDTELMKELQEVSAAVEPHNIILVADAMTGQEAVNVAKGFDEALEIDGLILTKMDGDARGGAALSMKEVTGRPIVFVGTGEKLDALDQFHPERMSSRILGMGDVMSLIEKASKQIDLEESMAMHDKFKKDEFSFDDFLSQLAMIKKMGSITSLMGMMPGMNKMMKQVNEQDAERDMKRIEAIILSMTKAERKKPAIINGTRRKRIAKGSGTSVEEVNRLLKQFTEMKKLMKQLTSGGMGGLMKMFGGKLPGMGGLGGMGGKFGF
jgi:signal recognition particle subunit SRP54